MIQRTMPYHYQINRYDENNKLDYQGNRIGAPDLREVKKEFNESLDEWKERQLSDIKFFLDIKAKQRNKGRIVHKGKENFEYKATIYCGPVYEHDVTCRNFVICDKNKEKMFNIKALPKYCECGECTIKMTIKEILICIQDKEEDKDLKYNVPKDISQILVPFDEIQV